MVRIGERSDGDKKSQLVINICNISNRAIGCAHWHRRRRDNVLSSPFIDWYLLLQVSYILGSFEFLVLENNVVFLIGFLSG